jgi:diguanylate cyclase (GGDEF)-like protein
MHQETSSASIDSPRTMAWTLAGLYIAGAAIGAMTLLLPHPSRSDDAMLWVNIGLAAGAAFGLAAIAGRAWLRPWMLQLSVGIGTLVITRAIYYAHDPGAFYSLWYVWVGLYTFFFFGRRWGAAHMAIVGIAYAWVLSEVEQTSPLSRWVMTVGTIAIAGILIDVLADRVRNRAEAANSQARSLEAVATVAHELAKSTSPEAAAPAVCRAAVDVAGADSATLWEPSPDGAGLVAVASTEPEMAGRTLLFVSRPSPVLRAFTSGEATFVAGRAERDGDDVGDRPPDDGSALLQPVSREETPIGVLAVSWDEGIDSLPPELGRVLNLLSVEAAIAIERAATLARLERVARTDDLTGLPNRRAWDEHLSRELARAKRDGTPLSVAIFDLDHFKDYNDRFGHQAGDRVLKEAAASWQGLVRKTDVLARYGGEEFALALPSAGIESASLLVERLRAATPRGERTSAGVVEWDGSETEAGLVARADAALYAAKRAGRDRAVIA